MPENYYCLDNFFHKVTDMESPRKNNDCYFYYYSTCTKGDSCTFRHEPSALGCETVCSFWKEGKCINVRCNFRHMELRKNRKVIPCYWEQQPGGCLKPHCPFLHQNPKHPDNNQGESSDLKAPQDLNKGTETPSTKGNEKTYGNAVVDPLVVNFEEESDNESAPSYSPVKTKRIAKVKTEEEIQLEKIQAESAKYYSYFGIEDEPTEQNKEETSGNDLRKILLKRINVNQVEDNEDFTVLSLEEIRKRKFGQDVSSQSDEQQGGKRQKVSLTSKPKQTDLSEVKIKTLAEIRAERAQRVSDVPGKESRKRSRSPESQQVESVTKKLADSEVSSTSSEVSSTSVDESLVTRLQGNVKPRLLRLRKTKPDQSLNLEKPIENQDRHKDNFEESVSLDEKDLLDESEGEIKNDVLESSSPNESESTKIEERFLLDDDDLEVEAEGAKDEEDIFKNIDELLND